MQTTLLGLAIAIILALLAALVGPLFIDWGSYRGEFEARASRLTGLDIRVAGAIDARLLPTPTLVLNDIEFGRPDEQVRARALRLEFALGSLVRGEWRITDARLEGPQLAAGLDGDGRLAWQAPKIGFDPEGVSIERLRIQDGRITLDDAGSGRQIVLDRMEFRGELRSLAGPVKGEGSFVVAGEHYSYRLAAGRIADDSGVKVRLALDPADRRSSVEADVSIRIEDGRPRFEGGLQLSRPAGRASAGGPAPAAEPWRIASRVKGDAAAAVLEQMEFQYGPDERAIKLKGNANLNFGPRPEITGVLSSPQVDLDRVLALPEAARRSPLAAIKALVGAFLAAPRLPLPAALSVGFESVTLGGATLTRVGADLKIEADGIEVNSAEFRAPGMTQVRLSGRLGNGPGGARFEGSTRIEAADARALVVWLTERDNAQALAPGQLRLSGDVALGGDAIAIDRLKLEVDRMPLAGRLTYAWAGEGKPARLDAALTSPDLDLDRVHGFARVVFGDSVRGWPREGSLSLEVARATVAGVAAKEAAIDLRADAKGIEIERFSVADFGGAALAVKGRIDTRSPGGALAFDLDARALDGIATLLEKLAPQAAVELRRSAGRLTPASLRSSLAIDPTGGAGARAKFKIDGRAGAFRVALQGDAAAANDAFKLDNLAALAAAEVELAGRLNADDGAALVDLVGLDRLVAADKWPGRLTVAAKGPLDGELAVDGQLLAGALSVSTGGTVRLRGPGGPSAAVDVAVAGAKVFSPQRAAAGQAAELLPASARARLAASEGTLRFTEVSGIVAGTRIGGRLAVGTQRQAITVDGDIELGTIDLPTAFAAATGMPVQSADASVGSIAVASATGGASGLWPAEPFELGLRRLRGRLAVKSAQVLLTPKLAAQDVHGVLQFGESELALRAIDGGIAGGRLTGDLTFLRRGDGLTARGQIRLAGASAADVLPGNGSLSGRLTLDLNAEGTGMSAVALVGSLGGGGTFALEDARLGRLDPAAFGAVIRAVDQGLPIDTGRVRERTDAALAAGSLAIARAEGAITIDAGQARLGNIVIRARDADLAVAGSLDLAEGAIDARMTLFGPAGDPAGARPEIGIALKGPVESPRRTIDVAALASWLALRAVEQQSKKLDVLEGRVAAPPSTAPAEGAANQSAPDAAPPEGGAPRAAGAAPAATSPQPASRTQSPAPAAAKPKSAAPSVQPLPPPIDIRPAPRAPRAQSGAASSQSAASEAQPQRPAAAPARPRSLSELLFGN